MTGKPSPPTKWKIDWAAASFVLALTIAILAAIQAYYTFNSDIERDVAVLKQQVAGLEREIANLRQDVRDDRRRPDG